jgi:CRISPR-associated protein Cas1
MPELLNVLYVQTQGASLHLDQDTVQIRCRKEEAEGEGDDAPSGAWETRARLPLLRLDGLVLFGRVSISPFLLGRCAEDGRFVVWLTQYGRFMGRLAGPVSGNVLLRRDQHRALADAQAPARIARQIVAGKIQNSRSQLLRGARDAVSSGRSKALAAAAETLAAVLPRLKELDDLDQIRGAEGEAARAYFDVFADMIRGDPATFAFNGRSRRPPRDATNAVLSFLYTLLTAECTAALESAGLDPQVGFLHALRPGRPALALDLVEELRAPFADRLALTLINRRQLQARHFEDKPGGAVYLNEEGRRALLVAYQERKAVEVRHRALDRAVPIGLVPHVQARLLARHLRGDIAHYPPFIYR